MNTTMISEPIYFIGIGGTGMAPLAEIALKKGMKVIGSDIKDSNTLKNLKKMGATIFHEHKKENLKEVKTVVYSSAINPDNEELHAAKNSTINVLHRSDLLSYFMKNKKAITVAGTHGKTTTSAMIAHMLSELGLNPTAAIGGVFVDSHSSSMFGDGEFFVAEADESDGSLLKYNPYISILTNVDHDHLDYFKDLNDLIHFFSKYISKTDPEGLAIIGWDNKYCQNIGNEYKREKLTYGFRIGSEIRAIDRGWSNNMTQYKVMVEKDQIEGELNLVGVHNIQNALCALSVARALDLDVKEAATALKSFKGVKRRLTPIYKTDNIMIFDDYAHNPGKIRASIKGIRETWPNHQINVIFQPHRFSRLNTMYNETMESFSNAHTVSVLPVFAAGEKVAEEYSPQRLADDISELSKTKAYGTDNFDSCITMLIQKLKRPSIFLTIGAGDIWELGKKLGDTIDAQKEKIHFERTKT